MTKLYEVELNNMGMPNFSTAKEVPQRIKGRWVSHPEIGYGETWLCSECGEKTTSTVMGEPRYNFCPMCGADMRGDEDEAD